jgi:hypothetical protein
MKKFAVANFLLCASSTLGFGASKAKLSELSAGSLSGDQYTNQALGIKFQVPHGWSANTDGDVPAGFDYHPAKEPSRQCVKVLLSHSVADSIRPEYKSMGLLFVLDPGCFPDAKFPRAIEEGQFHSFSGKMIHAFSKSPFIAPDGADIGSLQKESLIFVILTGGDTTQLGDGSSIHENLVIGMTERNGYWVGWAARTDDQSKTEIEDLENLKFWMGSGKMPSDPVK